MKRIKFLIAMAAFTLFISACGNNNNNNTGGIDSASVSTDPAMGGSTDSGMTSSDSTDIRMPMADSSQSGASDSSMHK